MPIHGGLGSSIKISVTAEMLPTDYDLTGRLRCTPNSAIPEKRSGLTCSGYRIEVPR